MCPYTEKHPKQLGYNAQNIIIVSVTPAYSEGVKKTPLKIGLINCQLFCKSVSGPKDGW